MVRATTVTVLISTYNGQTYLREQLESVVAQRGVTPRIIVRDDGSRDETPQILQEYWDRGYLEYKICRNIGPSASFMQQVFDAPADSYYAFCDQDDVWLPEKLNVAVDRLASVPQDRPALYFSALIVVNERLQELGSIVAGLRPTLGSVMVANPGAGCTFVFNRALVELLQRYRGTFSGTHDSWVLRVCLAVGGSVFYDDQSHILYRQHGNNAVGVRTLPKRLSRRLRRFVSGERPRENAARALLDCYSDILPSNNLELLRRFAHYRESVAGRLDLLRDAEVARCSPEQRVTFMIAALLGGL